MSDNDLAQGPSISRRQLLAGAVAGGAALASLRGLTGVERAFAATPKSGGALRIGIIGGGQAEQLDPNLGNTEIDVLRNRAIFEGLVEFGPNGTVINQLAEEISVNSDGSVWTFKLRPDVYFHNGKLLTADDVVYTLNYFLTPANKSLSYSLLAPVLAKSGIQKVDASTVRLNLTRPQSLLLQVLGERTIKIFQNGATAKQLGSDPIGTGPFMFKSWTRGERSLFLRNPHWSARGAFGPAYVDSLEALSITEPTARVDALSAGQVDAVADIGPALVGVVGSNSALTLLEGPSGAFTEFYMDTQAPPFNDNNVRLAFKMMIDREQMITNTLSGHGRIGNDLSSWFDPAYASHLPQRQYDPEQAKSLLKKAGHEGLKIQLTTGDFAEAGLESATLFATQAQAAGVTISLKTIPGDEYYTTYPLAPWGQSNWGGRPFVPFAQYAFVPNAPDNETRWNNAAWNKVYFEALASTNDAKRTELLVEAQTILYDQNGYLIWGFTNNLDACSAKLKGFVNSPIRPLDYYDMTHVYFT